MLVVSRLDTTADNVVQKMCCGYKQTAVSRAVTDKRLRKDFNVENSDDVY